VRDRGLLTLDLLTQVGIPEPRATKRGSPAIPAQLSAAAQRVHVADGLLSPIDPTCLDL